MEKTKISAVLKSHFLRLYQIALSDGEFSVLEIKMLYEFAEERGVSRAHLDEILLHPFDTNNLIPEDIDEKLIFLYDFAVMIWADGVITEDEQMALEKYIKLFGFMDENIKSLANHLIEAVKANISKQDILIELKN